MIKQIPDTTAFAALSSEWVDSLERKVNSLAGWDQQRSSKFKVHRATSSIELIGSPLGPAFHRQIRRQPLCEYFQADLAALLNLARARLPFIQPQIVRFLLVNLPARCSVDPHRDFGAGLMVGARLHLPIVTDEKVRFRVGETTTSLQRGVVYEINNSRVHAVNNTSDQDRIHAIVDVCDMWRIGDQVRYAVARGRRSPAADGEISQQPPAVPATSLQFCSGAIQQRLSQTPLPIHLFVLYPNNAGSTLLTRYIARCSHVAGLPREGQFMKCFRGPNPIALGVRHLFTEMEESFRDPRRYDWDTIKSGWYRHWRSAGEKSIFLEKSPPNILRGDLLKLRFPNVRFLLCHRAP